MGGSIDPQWLHEQQLQKELKDAQQLQHLSTRQILRLTEAGTAKWFAADTPLLTEGSEAQEVYLILSGMVSVGLYKDMSPALWLHVSGVGSLVDLCVLLDPPVAPVSIHALTDVQALAIPRDIFVQTIEDEPVHALAILRHLSNRLSLIARVTVQEFLQSSPTPSVN